MFGDSFLFYLPMSMLFCLPMMDGCLSPLLFRLAGSTSDPKGVMITHGNLGHNLTIITSELKAMTGGTGSYTLELSHYQAVPGNIRKAEHFVAFMRRFVEYLKVNIRHHL